MRLWMIAFCSLFLEAFATLEFQCQDLSIIGNTSQDLHEVICVINTTEDDYLSNKHAYYQISFHGLMEDEKSTKDEIKIDGKSEDATSSTINNTLTYNFTHHFHFKKGSSHNITITINFTQLTTVMLVDLEAGIFNKDDEYMHLLSIYSDFSIYRDSWVNMDCTAGSFHASIVFTRNLPKLTGIIIHMPSFVSVSQFNKSACTYFVPGANVLPLIECESNGTHIVLYNVIDKNIFTEKKEAILFSITHVGCTNLSDDQIFGVQTFNIYHSATVIGETLNIRETFSTAKRTMLVCIGATYKDDDTCKPCPATCSKCSEYDTCTKCIDEYYLLKKDCYLQCPSGQYNLNKELCGNCPSECLQCTNLSACTSCQENYVLDHYACLQHCKDDQYIEEGICHNCGNLCKKCNATTCLECIDSILILDGENCICNISLCENCPASQTGCSVCNGHYFYNYNQLTCDSCNLEPLQRSPIQLVYHICSGRLEFYKENLTVFMAAGYSGTGTNQNDICSLGTPNGTIPHGLYNITSLSCSIQGTGSSRVLVLTPIARFSDDTSYDQIFNSLYIYSADHQDPIYQFTTGQFGIVIDSDSKRDLTIGDTLKVITDDCNEESIKQCGKYPPPLVGTFSITMKENNAFRILFVGWGTDSKMDLQKYRYSAALNIKEDEFLELCDDAIDINSEGLLCNDGNQKGLGYLNSGAEYSLRVGAKYCYNISIEGVWSYQLGKITIANISVDNVTKLITADINSTSLSDLIYIMTNKQRAIDSLIEIPKTPSISEICPLDYCKNNGVCVIKNGRPRCRCLASSSGSTCTISSELYRYALTSNDQAASIVLTFLNTSNASQIIEALSIITSNSDLLSDSTISSICSIINASLDLPTSSFIDIKLLEKVVTNTLSSFIKNIDNNAQSAHRNLADKARNATKIRQLNVFLKGMTAVVKSSYVNTMESNQIITMDAEGFANISLFKATSISTLLSEVSVSTQEAAYACSIAYPEEVRNMFPTPYNLLNVSIVSNVVSLSTQNTAYPYDSMPTNKSILFMNNSKEIGKPQGKYTEDRCGYFDSVHSSFNSTECSIKQTTNGVECTCFTEYPHLYLVRGNNGTKFGDTLLVTALVVPVLAIIVVIIISVIIELKKRKKASRAVEWDVKSRASMVITPEL